jgi:uncharacterized protein (DUF433 family)
MNPEMTVTIDPEIQGGRPVLAGTRLPVQVVIGALASGMTLAEVCEEYYVTEEQVRAALAYAAQTLADETVVVAG